MTWNAVNGAATYKIYASDDPYGSFVDITSSGNLVDETWTIAATESKKFFYVVAFEVE